MTVNEAKLAESKDIIIKNANASTPRRSPHIKHIMANESAASTPRRSPRIKHTFMGNKSEAVKGKAICFPPIINDAEKTNESNAAKGKATITTPKKSPRKGLPIVKKSKIAEDVFVGKPIAFLCSSEFGKQLINNLGKLWTPEAI